jgi:DNA helicase-4
MKHDDLIRFVRTFMTHVKSNSLDREALTERLRGELRHLGDYRAALFVEMYWEIHDEWERRLRADNLVDFEDMLVLAADHLEAGRFDPGYDLVMVDEFQDASNARARIVRGLLRRPGRFLLAVGDDWQSVNRFAGSDLSVMTNFAEWFGHGPELRLETTFRCPQPICDAATRFVMRNPRQLTKEVRSTQVDIAPSVRIVRASPQGSAESLAKYLEELSALAIAGQITPGVDGRISVKVLGRYRFDDALMPKGKLPALDVQFLTVHRSKGLEADYIVVPRMVTGKYGFPSGIVDDPLLDLVMAAPDRFPHAEERRLFYVALTRARRGVLLITEQGYESPFVTELVNDGVAVVEGQPTLVQCFKCLKGTMVPRESKFGPFLGCSSYPACNHTQSYKAAG